MSSLPNKARSGLWLLRGKIWWLYFAAKATNASRWAASSERKVMSNLDDLFVIELVFVKENGNSWKYGFTTAEQVIGFLQGEIAAQQKMHPTLLESVPILDNDGELVGTRSVDIENPQSG